MRTPTLLVLVLTLIIASCGSTKATNSSALYNTEWELNFISGPRIAFNGLYPDKKPQISFDQQSERVSGTSSCNGYQAAYTLEGNRISFGEPGPTTMMYCGEGEGQFLNMMKKIDGYAIEGGQLILLKGDVPMMRFAPVTP